MDKNNENTSDEMDERKYTPEDTENDFNRFKAGEILWTQIRGFNDEHKRWIIRNKVNSSFLLKDDLMDDEMLKEGIVVGNISFSKYSLFG